MLRTTLIIEWENQVKKKCKSSLEYFSIGFVIKKQFQSSIEDHIESLYPWLSLIRFAIKKERRNSIEDYAESLIQQCLRSHRSSIESTETSASDEYLIKSLVQVFDGVYRKLAVQEKYRRPHSNGVFDWEQASKFISKFSSEEVFDRSSAKKQWRTSIEEWHRKSHSSYASTGVIQKK